MDKDDIITIGALSRRTGIAVSAIRFYEAKGLIAAQRSAGNQRRFLRSDIRRLSFILIAQKLGLGLLEIESELATLPQGRTPSLADWRRVSQSLRGQLDARIQLLTRTRTRLEQCIGCGCLSLQRCQLNNKDDRAGAAGTGPRYVLE